MKKHPLELFKFCPKCGSSRFGTHDEKSKYCADCGFVLYFNPIAATVALIFNREGELLVARRGKEPAEGTLDLPGGFLDCGETGEQGVARAVKEENGLNVTEAVYLFSLPNTYLYSGFLEHTLDLFFLCRITDATEVTPHDDVSELRWTALEDLNPDDFGLHSIREGIHRILRDKKKVKTLIFNDKKNER